MKPGLIVLHEGSRWLVTNALLANRDKLGVEHWLYQLWEPQRRELRKVYQDARLPVVTPAMEVTAAERGVNIETAYAIVAGQQWGQALVASWRRNCPGQKRGKPCEHRLTTNLSAA